MIKPIRHDLEWDIFAPWALEYPAGEHSPPLQIHGADYNVKNFLEFILDILFPLYCAGCGVEGTHMCKDCLGRIRKFSNRSEFQTIFSATNSHIDELFAATSFKEKSPLAELIHRFKYDSSKEIAPILTSLFSEELLKNVREIPNKIFVPIPLYWRREWNRGFNQSLLVAQELQKRTGGEIQKHLARSRFTKAQAMLSKEERQKNIRDAFKIVEENFKPRDNATYILVDDVYTTGSTMNECARILKNAGATKVFGMVIGVVSLHS